MVQARSGAAVDGRADDAQLGIVVGGEGILPGVEPGEPAGAGGELEAHGIGQTEVIQEQGALAVVHEVVVFEKLPLHLAVFRPLPGHAVPLGVGQPQDPGPCAQRVEQGIVLEGLEGVVRAVHSGPELPPDQGAVRTGVLVQEQLHRVLHPVHEFPFQLCPFRRLLRRAGGDDGDAAIFVHGVPPLRFRLLCSRYRSSG